MALRPLLFSALVGIAALGTFHTPAAQARGYVSISVGTPAPYYRGNYGRGYQRPGYALVPGYWASTYRGRVWVPARHGQVRAGYGQNRGSRYGYGPGYRSVPVYRPAPRGYYPPRHHRPHRGW